MPMRHTPERISKLAPDEVIIVGTNTAGRHGAGAAAQAHRHFGLELGIGEGLSGQSYAFPTLDDGLRQRADSELRESVQRLFKCAAEHPAKKFLLTKVGCGIAGYSEEYMASLFKNAPANIIKPLDW